MPFREEIEDYARDIKHINVNTYYISDGYREYIIEFWRGDDMTEDYFIHTDSTDTPTRGLKSHIEKTSFSISVFIYYIWKIYHEKHK